MPQLSVLIPALNEAQALPALLTDLAGQQGITFHVVVADGGSTDDTAALARRQGAQLLRAPRGRAAQLNAAVRKAQSPWLLCLHADSRLTAPDQLTLALRRIKQAHKRQQPVAGHWPLRFQRSQPGHEALFRHLEAKSASNRPGTVNGDQGLLIHRSFLSALGGFDESLPFYEDARLAARVFARGQFMLLPGMLETSARRFEMEGHAARLLLMALIVGADAAGLSDWLRELPAIYREQQAATRLQAKPFVDSLLAHIAGLPTAEQKQVWKAAAKLVADNAWQLAQALDALGGSTQFWLSGFDTWLAPRLSLSPLERLLAAALPLALPAVAHKIDT